MGLFFASIGMQIDLGVMFNNLPFILLAGLAIMFIKVTIIGLAGMLQKERPLEATSAGIMISKLVSLVLCCLPWRVNTVLTSKESSILIGMGLFQSR